MDLCGVIDYMGKKYEVHLWKEESGVRLRGLEK